MRPRINGTRVATPKASNELVTSFINVPSRRVALTKRNIAERPTAGITVGEMRRLLSIFDQDADLYVEGLSFFRFKGIGAKCVAMEFNETVKGLDSRKRRR